MRSSYFVVALTGSVIAWCAGGPSVAQTASKAPGAQQYPHRLSSAEIRDYFADHTNYMAGQFGPKTTAVYYSANGQIKARSPNGQDAGIYRITDDGLFCTKYNKFRNGQETCQTVWQTGPDSYEVHLPNGQIPPGATAHVSGNPEGL